MLGLYWRKNCQDMANSVRFDGFCYLDHIFGKETGAVWCKGMQGEAYPCIDGLFYTFLYTELQFMAPIRPKYTSLHFLEGL